MSPSLLEVEFPLCRFSKLASLGILRYYSVSLNNVLVYVLSTTIEGSYSDKLGLRLVTKLLTEKPINIDALKRNMNHIWSLNPWILIFSSSSSYIGKTRKELWHGFLGAMNRGCFCCKKALLPLKP